MQRVFEACEICAVKCLHEENVNPLARCVEMCITRYHACAAASAVMSAESDYSKKVCSLCAEVCEACAEECEKHSHMDHCKQCAEICRKCAEECRRVSK